MSKIFEEGMARRVRKSKSRTRPRSRQSKRRRKTTRQFLGQGPAQGLRLSYDPHDSHFPHWWVLSFGDLILAVSRSLRLDLWNELTEEHQNQCRGDFKPVPVEVQERRRRINNEEFRRIMFWDKVTRLGRRKHAKGPLSSVTVVSPRRGGRVR